MDNKRGYNFFRTEDGKKLIGFVPEGIREQFNTESKEALRMLLVLGHLIVLDSLGRLKEPITINGNGDNSIKGNMTFGAAPMRRALNNLIKYGLVEILRRTNSGKVYRLNLNPEDLRKKLEAEIGIQGNESKEQELDFHEFETPVTDTEEISTTSDDEPINSEEINDFLDMFEKENESLKEQLEVARNTNARLLSTIEEERKKLHDLETRYESVISENKDLKNTLSSINKRKKSWAERFGLR